MKERERVTPEENRAYHRGYRAGFLDGLAAGEKGNAELLDTLQLPIEALGLSSRPLNCLHACGCQRVRDVAGLPEEAILRMRNLGAKSAAEIVSVLHQYKIFGTAWDAFQA